MHLNQLRKAKYISFAEDREQVYAQRAMDRVQRVLAGAEHFMFTAIPEDDKEIDASVDAMKQCGVWKIPFPVTTFEFVGDFVPIGYKTKQDRDMVGFKIADKRIVIFIAVEQAEDKDGNMKDMSGEAGYVRWVFVRHLTNKFEWIDVSSDLAHDEVLRVFNKLMVTLHTRGIRRERWSGDHKVLPSRPEPSNSYTRVMVREAATGKGGTAIAGDRHRVRLHLRRGHIRNQPYGSGRASVRPQWIAPTLVGYADDGVIEHEAYVV